MTDFVNMLYNMTDRAKEQYLERELKRMCEDTDSNLIGVPKTIYEANQRDTSIQERANRLIGIQWRLTQQLNLEKTPQARMALANRLMMDSLVELNEQLNKLKK